MKPSNRHHQKIGILLVGLALLLLVIALPSNKLVPPERAEEPALQSPPPQKPDDRVNQYLKDTQLKIHWDQTKLKLQQLRDSGKDFESDDLSKRSDKSPLVLNQNQEENGFEPQIQPKSPTDLIYSEILDQNTQKQMDAAYLDFYKQRYIENARKDGWDVKLDKNLKIISIKPIKQSPHF